MSGKNSLGLYQYTDEHFSDVRPLLDKQSGIFNEGEAALAPANHDVRNVQQQLLPEGLQIRLSCPTCGKAKVLGVEWPELVAIRYNVSPHVAFNGTNLVRETVQWGFDESQHAWFPDSRCDKCGFLMMVTISPQEALAHVRTGNQRRWFGGQNEKIVTDRVGQIMRQAGVI